MPFVLILVALVLIVAAIRDKLTTLTGLLVGDFTGDRNFVYFILAIVVLGAVGYVEKLKPVSDAFLLLVLLVLFISNKGFFSMFTQQIGAGTTPTIKDNQSLNPDISGFTIRLPALMTGNNPFANLFSNFTAPGHGAVGF